MKNKEILDLILKKLEVIEKDIADLKINRPPATGHPYPHLWPPKYYPEPEPFPDIIVIKDTTTCS